MLVELKKLGSSNLLAVLVYEERIAVGVKTCCLVGKESANGVALASWVCSVLSHGLLNHLVLVVANVEVGVPSKVLCLDVACAKGNLHTLVVHTCPVDGSRRESTLKRQHLQADEVGAVTIVIVYRQRDGIAEESQVETGINVLRLLPLEVRVRSRLAVDDILGSAWQDSALLQYTY